MSKWCVSGWACRSCKFIMLENTDFKVKEQAMLPNEKVSENQRRPDSAVWLYGYIYYGSFVLARISAFRF